MKETDKIYFLNCFRNYIYNSNKEFSRKYSPSIRELLNDYVELYDDILKSTDSDKLKKSHSEQLDVIVIFITKSIFFKSTYNRDLSILVSKINEYKNKTKDNESKSKDYFLPSSIYSMCTSFLKKLNYVNLYKEIVNIVYSTASYSELDNCVETLINELIFDGYSLIYIKEWYKYVVDLCKIEDRFDYDKFINEICNLKRDKKEYNIYLTIKNDNMGIEEWFIDYNLQMEFVNKQNLMEGIQKHLQFNGINRAIKFKIKAIDGYAATFNVLNSFKSYFLIINLMSADILYSVNDKISFENEKSKEINHINISVNDAKIILPKIDSREKYDLQDFVKYRKNVYEKNIVIGEITSIERCLNILKDSNSENNENRLIELWSVLEYLLSYYSGNSIIGKAKEIIPKIMCLYLLKDKLNIFWSILQKSLKREEIVEDFINKSLLSDSFEKYDIKKLLYNVQHFNKTLIGKFGYNSQILDRKYCEIGGIISKKIDIVKYLKEIHEMIEADIIRIYRTRNIIVHSGNLTKTNVLLKNARLMQYISNLIGVILYYKMKNNEHTIKEILYSIPETYRDYFEQLNKLKNEKNTDKVDMEEVFKPKYLFL